LRGVKDPARCFAFPVREEQGLTHAAYRGIVLATAAMVIRNAVLLGVLAPLALVSAGPAFLLMLIASAGLVFRRDKQQTTLAPTATSLDLRSPFSLLSALKVGLLFLALEVAGTLAQRWLGEIGFYAVSLLGGLISSASAVASAGSLASKGAIAVDVAGTGAVLASLTSALVNLPLAAQIARERSLTLRVAAALALIVALGVAGVLFSIFLLPRYRFGP
jgi:uncharacterized membrane protein (DUF4010 family)